MVLVQRFATFSTFSVGISGQNSISPFPREFKLQRQEQMVNLQRFPRIFEALLGNNRVSRDITKVNRSSLYTIWAGKI